MTTNNKKIGLFAILGVFAVAGTFMMSNLDQSLSTTEFEPILQSEPEDASYPNEYQFKTGVALLTSEKIPSNDNLSYHRVSENQFGWLSRAVQNGVAIVTEKEIDQYFTMFGKEHNNFEVVTKDAVNYYRITYSEPPLDIEKNYVYVYEFDEANPSHKALNSNFNSALSQAMEKPFRWHLVDDTLAQSLKSELSSKGITFKSTTTNGDKSFNVLYVGKNSQEFTNPEIRAMYNVQSEGMQ